MFLYKKTTCILLTINKDIYKIFIYTYMRYKTCKDLLYVKYENVKI